MNCQRCNRPIPLPPLARRAVVATAEANKVPQKSLKLTCARCLHNQEAAAKAKELTNGN